MASKLNPNVLYVAEPAESLGSPQADTERTHIVSIVQPSMYLKQQKARFRVVKMQSEAAVGEKSPDALS